MKQIPFILIFLIFVSCNGGDEVSDAYGNFEATEIIVSAETNGQILGFNVELGEDVKPGQQIGLIDTSQLYFSKQHLMAKQASVRTKLKTIKSQMQVIQAEKSNLLTEKNRIEKLHQDGAATRAQVDNVQGKLDIINARMQSVEVEKETIYAELRALQAQIRQIGDQLNNCKIMNPVNGTVLEKYVEAGEMAAMGKPLYKIADLTQMGLKAYISGDQLSDVKIGQHVKVLIDKNKEENFELDGTVAWISGEAEFTPKIIQTKDMRVDLVYAFKVHVRNDGRIKIGMPGEVRF